MFNRIPAPRGQASGKLSKPRRTVGGLRLAPIPHARNLVALLFHQAPNDGLDLLPWHGEPLRGANRCAVASDDRRYLRLVAARLWLRLRHRVRRRRLRCGAGDGRDTREAGHRRAAESALFAVVIFAAWRKIFGNATRTAAFAAPCFLSSPLSFSDLPPRGGREAVTVPAPSPSPSHVRARAPCVRSSPTNKRRPSP